MIWSPQVQAALANIRSGAQGPPGGFHVPGPPAGYPPSVPTAFPGQGPVGGFPHAPNLGVGNPLHRPPFGSPSLDGSFPQNNGLQNALGNAPNEHVTALLQALIQRMLGRTPEATPGVAPTL